MTPIPISGPENWGAFKTLYIVPVAECGETFNTSASRQAILVQDSQGSEFMIKLFLSSNESARDDFKRECSALRQLKIFPCHKAVTETIGFAKTEQSYPLRVLQLGTVIIEDIEYNSYLMEKFVCDMNNGKARQLLLDHPSCCMKFLNRCLYQLHLLFAKGLCHHDLKPDNICATSLDPETVDFVVIDFGHVRKVDAFYSCRGNPNPAGTHGFRSIDLLGGTATYRGDVESLVISTLTILGCSMKDDAIGEKYTTSAAKFFEARKRILGIRYCQSAKVTATAAQDMATSYLTAYQLTADHPAHFALSILRKLLVEVFTTDALKIINVEKFIELTSLTSLPASTSSTKSRLKAVLSATQQSKIQSNISDDFDVNAFVSTPFTSKMARRQFTAVVGTGSQAVKEMSSDPRNPNRILHSEGAKDYQDHFVWQLLQRFNEFDFGAHAFEDVCTAVNYFENCVRIISGVMTRDQICMEQVWKMSQITDNFVECDIKYDKSTRYEYRHGMVANKESKHCISDIVLKSINMIICNGTVVAFTTKSYNSEPATFAPLRCNPTALCDAYLRVLLDHGRNLRSGKSTHIYVFTDAFEQHFSMSIADIEYNLYLFFLLQHCKLIQRALDFSSTPLVLSSQPSDLWLKVKELPLIGGHLTSPNCALHQMLFETGQSELCVQPIIDFARADLPVLPVVFDFALKSLQSCIPADQEILILTPGMMNLIDKEGNDLFHLVRRKELLDFIFGSNEQRSQLSSKSQRKVIGVLYDAHEGNIKQADYCIFVLQYQHDIFDLEDPLFMWASCTDGVSMPSSLMRLQNACNQVNHWLGRIIHQAINHELIPKKMKERHLLQVPQVKDRHHSSALSILCVDHIVLHFQSEVQEPISCLAVRADSAEQARNEVLSKFLLHFYNGEFKVLPQNPMIRDSFELLKATASSYMAENASMFQPMTEHLRISHLSLLYYTQVNSSWTQNVTKTYYEFHGFEMESYLPGHFQNFFVAESSCQRLNNLLSAYSTSEVFCLNFTQQNILLSTYADKPTLIKSFERVISKNSPSALQHFREAKFICTPMFDGNNHWVLVIVDQHTRRIIVIDSFSGKSTHTLLAKIQRFAYKLRQCGFLDEDWVFPLSVSKFSVLKQIDNCCLFLALTVMEWVCTLAVQNAQNGRCLIHQYLSSRFAIPSKASEPAVSAALRLYFLAAHSQLHRPTAMHPLAAMHVYVGSDSILTSASTATYDYSKAQTFLIDEKMYSDKTVWTEIWRQKEQNSERAVASLVQSKIFTSNVDEEFNERPDGHAGVTTWDFYLDESIIIENVSEQPANLQTSTSNVDPKEGKALELALSENVSIQTDTVRKRDNGLSGKDFEQRFDEDSRDPPHWMPEHLNYINADSDELQYVPDIDSVTIASTSMTTLFKSFQGRCLIEIFESPRRPRIEKPLRLGKTFGIHLSKYRAVQIGQVIGMSNSPMEILVLKSDAADLEGSGTGDVHAAMDEFWACPSTTDIYRSRRSSSRVRMELISKSLSECFACNCSEDVYFAALMVGSKNDIRLPEPIKFQELDLGLQALYEKLSEAGFETNYLSQSSSSDVHLSLDFGVSIRHISESMSVHFPRYKMMQLLDMTQSKASSVKDCLAHKDFIAYFHDNQILSSHPVLDGVTGVKFYGTAPNEVIARQLKASFFSMSDQVVQACVIPNDATSEKALKSIDEFFHDGQELVKRANNVTQSWARIEISSTTVTSAIRVSLHMLSGEKHLVCSPVKLIWGQYYSKLLDDTLTLLTCLSRRLLFGSSFGRQTLENSEQQSTVMKDSEDLNFYGQLVNADIPGSFLNFLCSQEIETTNWQHLAYYKSISRFLIEGLTESLPKSVNNLSSYLRAFVHDSTRPWFLQLPTLQYFVNVVTEFYGETEPVYSKMIPNTLLGQTILWESHAKVSDVNVDADHRTFSFHVRHVFECTILLCAKAQDYMRELWIKTAKYVVSSIWWNLVHSGMRLHPTDFARLKSKDLALTEANLNKYAKSLQGTPLTFKESDDSRLCIQHLENMFCPKQTPDGTHHCVLANLIVQLRLKTINEAIACFYAALRDQHMADVIPMTAKGPQKLFQIENAFVKLGVITGETSILAIKIRSIIDSEANMSGLFHSPKVLTMKETFRLFSERLKTCDEVRGDAVMNERVGRIIQMISTPNSAKDGKKAVNTLEFKTKFYNSVVAAYPAATGQNTWPESVCEWFLLKDYVEALQKSGGDDSDSEIRKNNRTSIKLYELVRQASKLTKLKEDVSNFERTKTENQPFDSISPIKSSSGKEKPGIKKSSDDSRDCNEVDKLQSASTAQSSNNIQVTGISAVTNGFDDDTPLELFITVGNTGTEPTISQTATNASPAASVNQQTAFINTTESSRQNEDASSTTKTAFVIQQELTCAERVRSAQHMKNIQAHSPQLHALHDVTDLQSGGMNFQKTQHMKDESQQQQVSVSCQTENWREIQEVSTSPGQFFEFLPQQSCMSNLPASAETTGQTQNTGFAIDLEYLLILFSNLIGKESCTLKEPKRNRAMPHPGRYYHANSGPRDTFED